MAVRGLLVDIWGVIVVPGETGVNQELLDYLHSILPAYQLAFFTASLPGAVKRYQSSFPAQAKIYLSILLGHSKRQARAYEKIAQELGVKPAELLFIDDYPDNCQAAAEAGLPAVCYQANQQLFAALAEYGLPTKP